jgi:hypothetical protein
VENVQVKKIRKNENRRFRRWRGPSSRNPIKWKNTFQEVERSKFKKTEKMRKDVSGGEEVQVQKIR